MIRIQKFDLSSFGSAFGILCGSVEPWKQIARPPFGSMWCVVEPGGTASAHNHHEGEVFVIVSGAGLLSVDQEQVEVAPGDVIYLPPLSIHRLHNTSQDQELRFLSIYWEDIALLNEVLDVRAHIGAGQSTPQRVLVTATPPTPNGDLHLGHLSGPYLAADIYTRFLRMCGVEVYYISGADDHQSYVDFKGRQIGLTPSMVADQFGDAIEATLDSAQINIDLFARPRLSAYHIPCVISFFQKLYRDGKFIAREVETYYCETCAMYLFEAFIRGNCPHCGLPTSGNACEDCGRPNDCIDLIDPVCRLCGNIPQVRTYKRLYFPLSQYQQQLSDYVQTVHMGAHMRVLCEKMLADGLPDIAISHMADWGIPVPLEGFAGQRLYVWFEMAPGYLSATQEALNGQLGGDEWRLFWSGDQAKVVQFFGFDNGYFHALLFPALFMAYDPSIRLPDTFVTNEFYRLDSAKFSTSRVHAIWGRELIGQVPSDMVRFFLSYDRPETEQTNFTLGNFSTTIQRELLDAWQPWLQGVFAKVSRFYQGAVPEAGAWSEEQVRFYDTLRQIAVEVAVAYQDTTFSPQRATRLLCELVRASRRFGQSQLFLFELPSQSAQQRTAVALEVAAARLLALLAAPLMPGFAQQLWSGLGHVMPMRWETQPSLVPGGQRIRDPEPIFFPTLDMTSARDGFDAVAVLPA